MRTRVQNGQNAMKEFFDFDRLKDLTANTITEKEYTRKTLDNGAGSKLEDPLISIHDSNKDDQRLLFDPYYKDNHYNASCSQHLNLYMSSLIRN